MAVVSFPNCPCCCCDGSSCSTSNLTFGTCTGSYSCFSGAVVGGVWDAVNLQWAGDGHDCNNTSFQVSVNCHFGLSVTGGTVNPNIIALPPETSRCQPPASGTWLYSDSFGTITLTMSC